MSSLAAFNRVMRVLQTYANIPASEVRALAQELDDLPGAAGASVTGEALTIPVDYENPSSIVIPAGTKFALQDDVQRALGSAPGFKYLMDCWEAIPATLAHDVTFDLKAGVHRPRSTDPTAQAFNLVGKTTTGGSAIFQGAASSLWTTVVGPLTVSSITGGSDPSMTFAGTPFAGLNLRGLHVVLSTAQVAVIHDHNDSTLKVTAILSPTPVGGTATVARPSTIIRNSLNDIAPFTTSATLRFNVSGVTDLFSGHRFQDLRVDTFSGASSGWMLLFDSSPNFTVTATRILNDYREQREQFGRFQDGRTFQFNGTGQALIASLIGLRCTTDGGGVNEFLFQSGSTFASFTDCVAYNPRTGSSAITISGSGATVRLSKTVLDWINSVSTEPLINCTDAELQLIDGFGTGAFSQLRNGIGGVALKGKAKIGIGRFTAVKFKNVTTFCLSLADGAQASIADAPAGFGLRDDTGNTGIGIDVVGPYAMAKLNAGTDVTGTTGDMRFPGAVIKTYAQIVAAAPAFTDAFFNFASKPS